MLDRSTFPIPSSKSKVNQPVDIDEEVIVALITGAGSLLQIVKGVVGVIAKVPMLGFPGTVIVLHAEQPDRSTIQTS